MQRITEGFTTFPVHLQLDGLPPVPVPAHVVILTLLKVNLPFTMPVLENGVVESDGQWSPTQSCSFPVQDKSPTEKLWWLRRLPLVKIRRPTLSGVRWLFQTGFETKRRPRPTARGGGDLGT